MEKKNREYKIFESYVKHCIPFLPSGYFTENYDNDFQGILKKEQGRYVVRATLINSHGISGLYSARRYYLGNPTFGLFFSPGYATGYLKNKTGKASYIIFGFANKNNDYGLMPGLYKFIPGIVFIKITRKVIQ